MNTNGHAPRNPDHNSGETNPPRVYIFEVHRKRPGLGTFGCVARSESEAFFKVGEAGHTSPVLRFVRDLMAHEKSDTLNAVLLYNPLLGPEWMPFVSSVAHALTDMPVDSFAVVEFPTPAFDEHGYPSPLDGPYFQVWHERDGSLSAEVGYGPTLVALRPQTGSVLDFLGFTAPVPGDPDHPNFGKKYQPGWNPRFVINEMLTGMILSGAISTESGFTVQGPIANKVGDLGLAVWNSQTNMFHTVPTASAAWNDYAAPPWWPFANDAE